MIDTLLKKLAEFIVAAALAQLGIKDIDDLTAKLAAAFKAELADELGKLDDLPEQVTAELAALPAKVLAGLPDFAAIINSVLAKMNPFGGLGR